MSEESADKGRADVVHFITRDEIFSVDDRVYEVVDVPEWGPPDGPPAAVRVRGLTGAERDKWEASLLKEDPTGGRRSSTASRMDYSNLRAKLIVHSVVDGEGNRLFQDRDVERLGRKSAAALQRIFEVCQKVSRLTNEDVDELVGNSDAAQNGAGGSGSPSPSEAAQ